ncbi:MAG: hypothetical protein D6706_14500 [Chloroflexi bacterium]|nr:MAG: hypothetical protein D6706_14500 [Chloroflexota bacterium]
MKGQPTNSRFRYPEFEPTSTLNNVLVSEQIKLLKSVLRRMRASKPLVLDTKTSEKLRLLEKN